MNSQKRVPVSVSVPWTKVRQFRARAMEDSRFQLADEHIIVPQPDGASEKATITVLVRAGSERPFLVTAPQFMSSGP